MDTANVVLTHGAWAFLVVWAFQKLKKAKWFPWLRRGQAWVTRSASVLVSLAIGLGIGHSWNPSMNNGTLVLTGLSWAVLGPKLMTVMAQYVTQESGYQVLQGIQAAQSVLRYIESGMLPQVPPVQKVTAEDGPVVSK